MFQSINAGVTKTIELANLDCTFVSFEFDDATKWQRDDNSTQHHHHLDHLCIVAHLCWWCIHAAAHQNITDDECDTNNVTTFHKTKTHQIYWWQYCSCTSYGTTILFQYTIQVRYYKYTFNGNPSAKKSNILQGRVGRQFSLRLTCTNDEMHEW